jgi:hypothetical protein
LKTYLKALAGAVALCVVSTVAHATVVKFDNFDEGGSVYDARGPVVSEGGFNISATSNLANVNQPDVFGQWTNASGYDADPVGHTLFVNFRNITTTIASATNAAFDFKSIDLGDVYDNGSSGSIRIDWDIFGGGTGSLLVALDALKGLQTFVVNAIGVQAVKITGVSTPGTWLQMDNIVLNAPVVSAIPVPAALPMFLSGLAGLAALRRRKRRA